MPKDQRSSSTVAIRFALAALFAISALAFAATGTTAAGTSFVDSVRGFLGLESKAFTLAPPVTGTRRFGRTLSVFESDDESYLFFGPLVARTWANAGTDFNTAGNWLVALPTNTDIATFTGAASVQPNVSSNITVSGVNFSDAASSGYNLSSSSSSIKLLLNSTTTGATGAINSANSGGTNTVNAPLILNAASGTQTFTTQASGGTLIINGVISSTNSPLLSLAGSGTAQINGLNLHTGGTTVNTGTFQFGNDNAFGSGTFSVGSSTFTIIQATGGSRTFSNNVVWGGSSTISGGNSFTFNGSFTSSGSNSRTMTVSNTGGLTLGGNVFLSETDSSNRTFTILGTSPVTINGVVTNNNVGNTQGSPLLYTGNSTLTLSNTNTYGGNTSVSGGGTLSVATIGNSGASGGPGAGATINLGSTSSSGTLLYTGSGENTSKIINLLGQTGGATIDQSGTGLLRFTATNLTAAGGTGAKTLMLQGSTAGTGEIASDIKDNSGANKTSLAKTGTGSWTLSAANDYMGTTTINAGKLFVTGSTSPESAVTVNNTGTLGGTGSVLGPTVTVASGGTVAPGLSPGILNIGNSGNSSALSFASGSTYAVEIGGTTAGNASNNHDQLNIYGTVSLGNATLSLSAFNGFTPSAGQTFTIINKNTAGAITGTFNSLAQGATITNFLGSGLNATISYTGGDGNDVVITVSAPANHTVTFDANGGTGSMSNQTANVATNLTANAFTRIGYTFANWNTVAGGGGTTYADQASYPFTTDATLYAQWTINSYTLTYNGNTNTGGTAPTGATQNYNTTIAVASAGSLVKSNSTFTGWNTAADGSGTPFAPATTFTFTADTTLYAQWASGTSAGDFFRSRVTGNWGTPATWESSSDNSTWITATLSPTAAANTITVSSPDTVTVAADVTADQVTVANGGTLAVNSGVTFTLNDGFGIDLSLDGVLTGASSTAVVAGGGSIAVNNTGILAGIGTVLNPVTVASGGKISPGLSPGILNIGDSTNTRSVTFASGSRFVAEIGGPSAGNASNNYDQLNVYGAVNLGNVILDVSAYNGFTPSGGESYTIINKNTAGAVSGLFAGFAEGDIISTNFLGSFMTGKISYVGGDGNDVVILVTAPPPHTVIFDGNGSTGGSMSNQTTNIPTNLTANAFIRAGYVFDHWNTAADDSGTQYPDGTLYPFSADITLYAQWTGIPVISASGALGFGNQNINTTSSTQNVTITNTGGADLSVTDISIIGSDSTQFGISSQPGTPFTITPGNNAIVQIVFSPTTAGSKSASVSITSDGGPASVSLTGTGVIPPSISGAATTAAFATTYGTASAAQNFPVSGSNLTADITATAPAGFEVSNGGAFGTTTTFTNGGGSASGTLSIRLKANAPVAGSYNSQNIVLSSTGASNVNITTAASGNVVSPASVTVTASSPTVTYGDAVPAITASYGAFQNGENSSVVTTLPTCGTAYTPTSNAGTSPLTSCSGAVAANYTFSYTAGSVTIGKAASTTNFTTTAPITLPYHGTYVPAATNTGDGTTSILAATATCSLSGVTIRMDVSSGTCTVKADTPTTTNYLASFATQIITATNATATVTFNAAPTPTYLGGNFTASASTNNTDDSTLTYSYVSGPCAFVSGATFSSSGAGTCIVQADGAASTNFNAASAQQSVTIAQAAQTITFNSLTDKTIGGPDFGVSATSDSSLTVSFASQTPSVCTVSTATVHLVTMGTCTIRSSQAGDSNYSAAANVDRSFAVNTPLTDDFVITVKTDNAGTSTSTQFTIPTTGGGYNYNVDCDNDGTNEATAQTGNYTCSYGVAGTYTVRIKDNTGLMTGFPRLYFNDGGDKQKLLTVEQWGTGKWTSMANAFWGCGNLAGQASDSPDLSGVTDMGRMFEGASLFNQNIGSWDTSTVTTMATMFDGASSFNQNIGSWNTANVVGMGYMFKDTTAFNQDIGSWNTGNVVDMTAMFQDAASFNQNIGAWDTSHVTAMSGMFAGASSFNQNIGNWNTANVVNFGYMFSGASSFNQNIGGWNTSHATDLDDMFKLAISFNQNIGSWNTASVSSMNAMFAGASAFNQNIGNWNTANVTDMGAMFSSAFAFNQNIGSWNVTALINADGMFNGVTLSTANYDALLNGWDSQVLKPGVTFSGGNSTYCAGLAARGNITSSDGWTITDGGIDSACTAGTGRIKVCKITADPVNLPIGTAFTFTISGLAGPLPGTGTTVQFDVLAGPASQGGFCAFAPGTWIVGEPLFIGENGISGTNSTTLPLGPAATQAALRVSVINSTSQFLSAPVSGFGFSISSNPEFIAPNAGYKGVAAITALDSVAEIDFTDFVYRPAILKLCKTSTTIAVGTPFSFNIAPVDPTSTFPYSTAPKTVPVGSCSFLNGPFPSDPAFPGIGLFNLGTAVTVTENSAAGTTLSAITSPTVTGMTPDVLIVDLLNRRGTITLNHDLLVNSGISEISFANSVTAPVPDLTAAFTDGVTQVNAGSNTTYTATLTNNGPSAADGTTISSPPAAGIVKTGIGVCVSANGAVCPAVGAGAGQLNIANLETGTVIVPTLPASGSITFTITVNVTATSGTVTNIFSAAVPAGSLNPNLTNNAASDTDDVTPVSDLAVTKTDGVASVSPGSNTTYTVTLANYGPSSADGSTIGDAAVAGLTKSAIGVCTATGGAVCPASGQFTIANLEAGTVVVPTLPAGGSISFSITANVTATGGTLTNTFTSAVPSGTLDYNLSNNTSSDTDTVTPVVSLAITKTDGLTSVIPGQTVLYTITVTNSGPNDLVGGKVVDNFPASVVPGSWYCSAPGYDVCSTSPFGSGDLNETVTIAAGTSIYYQVNATVVASPANPIVNTATVTLPAGPVDNDLTNNSATDSDAIDTTNDFILTVKTDNPGTSSSTQFTIPTTGSGYNYNVDCNNDGTNEATAQSGDYTCSYGAAGTYTVRIKDNTGAKTGFPRIYFNGGGDRLKLLTIDQWGTGKWTSMANAFFGCANLAGQASDSPDLTAVTDMSQMFLNASSFNQNIGTWNTSSVTNMATMFDGASSFNQNIGSWNTANVVGMSYMFKDATAFNQDIGSWNTGSVLDTSAMFQNAASFNQNIGAWDTSRVINMIGTFAGASSFNQNIGNWNTGNVANFAYMFSGASSFNQNIGGWNTSKATNLDRMFTFAISFNQNIGIWNTANVTSMNFTFAAATSFNQNIGSWNTGNVTNMGAMFADAKAFNQNISGWDTSKVVSMDFMFQGASAFNQNIGSWNVTALTNAGNMFDGVTLSTANYDALLNGWDPQVLKPGVTFSGGSSKYCSGAAARSNMISSDAWVISDGGIEAACSPPTATSINPSSGTTLGGTSVTITGAAFTGATAVTIGGLAATSVIVVNDSTITAITPADSAGPASVVVSTPNGSNSVNSLFTYVTPTITAATATAAFTTTYGTASAAQNFPVSGSNLTADITATAPAGFEVSNGGAFGPTTTFTQSGGSASGTLRIRLRADAPVAGSYNSQNIVLSSTGASPVNITTAASGNAASPASVTVTASSPTVTYSDPVPTITASYSAFENGENSGVLTTLPTCSTTYTPASNAGSAPLTSCSGAAAANYTFSYTPGSVTINQAVDTPSVSNLGQTYTGSPITITVSCLSGGIATAITPSTATNVGSTPVTASCPGNTNYSATSNAAAGNLTINQAPDTPSVSNSGQIYTGSPITITVSCLSGGTATAISPSAATPAGSTPVTASCPGNTNYSASTNAAAGNFTINPATPTASITNSPVTYNGSPQNATVVCLGGGTATLASGGSGTNAGSYPAAVDCGASTNYSAAAGLAAGSFVIQQATQTITFNALGAKTIGDPDFGVTASGGASGNAVMFASQTPSVCTTGGTNGATVHLLTTGVCTIRASQAGNTNYSAAADVDRSFNVNAVINHTVAFDANGGTGSMDVQVAGVPTNLTANAFTRTGYTFENWNTIPAGGGTTYTDQAQYSFAADATLYAQWAVDNMPPVITYTPLAYTTSNANVLLSANVTDNVAVASVSIFYSVNGGSFTSAACTAGVPPAYNCTLPGQPTGTAVSYYVSATDTAGNTATNPGPGASAPNLYTVGPATIPGGFGVTYSNVSLSDGSSLGGDVIVTGVLELGGIVTTGAFTLELTCSGTVANAGVGNYVVGNFRKDFCSTGTFMFPVGTVPDGARHGMRAAAPQFELEYSPATVLIYGGALPASLTISVTDSVLPGLNAGKSVTRYWTLTQGGGPISADLTFRYLDQDVNGVESDYKVFKNEDNATSEVSPSTIDSIANQATVTGVTSFSKWGVGVLVPTSGGVSVKGRVVTAAGRAIPRALVSVSGPGLAEPTAVMTGPGGYYHLEGLDAGRTYVITVNAKRYRFAVPTRIISLGDNLTGIDFVASP